MLLWDVHAHLPEEPVALIVEILDRARARGVAGVVLNGCDFASNLRVLECSREYPGRLYASLGMHPEREIGAEEWGAILGQIEEHRGEIVAVGEVGLPYYSLPGNRNPEKLFQAEMRLVTLFASAQKWGCPVILHAPHERARRVLDLLVEFGIRKALFHWHKAPEAVTEEIITRGYFISVTPEVCYRQRDRDLVSCVPLTQLLVESDSPWPHGGEFENLPSEPWMVSRVAAEIAAIKRISREEASRQLALNSAGFFGIPLSSRA